VLFTSHFTCSNSIRRIKPANLTDQGSSRLLVGLYILQELAVLKKEFLCLSNLLEYVVIIIVRVNRIGC